MRDRVGPVSVLPKGETAAQSRVRERELDESLSKTAKRVKPVEERFPGEGPDLLVPLLIKRRTVVKEGPKE